MRHGHGISNVVLLPMLQKNHELDKVIYVIFATDGSPKQFHFYKKYTINQNDNVKGYAFKDCILDCV